MPRRARLDAPGATHHVMIRGVGGADLFLDADDRHDYVARLCRVLPACGARCFAWALLSNHAHFVIQSEAASLSRVMRRLGTGHAMRFNQRTRRRGYVFMDRFRSRLVESDADLIGLVRYVHRNPLEAGLVPSLDALARYPWSGHGALVGARTPHAFEAVGVALSLFDEDAGRARAELLAWMARYEEPLAAEGSGERVGASAPAEPRVEARGDLAALLRAACARYSLALDQLRSGSKQPRVVRARSAVAYLAAVALEEPGANIARALGVSPSAVSGALDRGRRIALEDRFWLQGEPEAPPQRGESENPKT